MGKKIWIKTHIVRVITQVFSSFEDGLLCFSTQKWKGWQHCGALSAHSVLPDRSGKLMLLSAFLDFSWVLESFVLMYRHY